MYIANPKESTYKLLELKNKFSKVTGHKLNIQTSTRFPYTSKKRYENDIKESIRKNKIHRNKFIKRSTRLKHGKLQNVIERNEGRSKSMERHPVLMNLRTKYC